MYIFNNGFWLFNQLCREDCGANFVSSSSFKFSIHWDAQLVGVKRRLDAIPLLEIPAVRNCFNETLLQLFIIAPMIVVFLVTNQLLLSPHSFVLWVV